MADGFVRDRGEVAALKCVHDGLLCIELSQCLDCPILAKLHPQFAAEVACEGCGNTDPAALIFLNNASWAAIRCRRCAVHLLTSLDLPETDAVVPLVNPPSPESARRK